MMAGLLQAGLEIPLAKDSVFFWFNNALDCGFDP